MFDVVMAAAFKYMQGADDVAVYVGMRVFDRVTHTRLRCEMYDLVEFLAREQGFHGGPILETDPLHTKLLEGFQQRGPRLFQRDVVVVVEIIQADDGVTALQ